MTNKKINYNNPYWMVDLFTDFFHSRKGKRYSPDTPEYNYIWKILNSYKDLYGYMYHDSKKKGTSFLSFNGKDIPKTFKLRKFEISFSTCDPIKGPFFKINIWVVSNIIPNIIRYMDTYKKYIEAGNTDFVPEENIEIAQCSFCEFMGNNNDMNYVFLEDLANFAFKTYEPFHLADGKFNKLLRKDAIKDNDDKIIFTNILGKHICLGVCTKFATLIMSQSMFLSTLLSNSLSVYINIDMGGDVDEYGNYTGDFVIKDLDMIALAGIERAIMKERKINISQASVLMKRAFFDYISPSYTVKDINKETYYGITKLIDLINFINTEELEKKSYTEASMALLDEFQTIFKNKTQIENY